MVKKLMAVAVLCAFAAGNSGASTIALTWAGTGSEGSSAQTRGWAFSSNTAINIASLGYFDFGNDGLAASHRVGIWDSLGNLLLSGTVAAGTAEPLMSGFRYTDTLSGQTSLAAGTYVVAGLSYEVDATWRLVDPAAVTMGAGITYIGDRTSGTAAFSYPAIYQAFDVGYFGANFQYDLAAEIPEPAALPLSLLALGLLGAAARMPRRSISA